MLFSTGEESHFGLRTRSADEIIQLQNDVYKQVSVVNWYIRQIVGSKTVALNIILIHLLMSNETILRHQD